MSRRVWSYRGFVIRIDTAVDPRLAYQVWITPSHLIAERSLAELQASIDYALDSAAREAA